MHEIEVARFEQAGDVRTMSIVEMESGELEVRERLTGPSTLIAYGEDEKSLRASFTPQALSALLSVVGRSGNGSLADYLTDENNDIVDLMDLCDAHGIPYSFVSIGTESGVCIRPAG